LTKTLATRVGSEPLLTPHDIPNIRPGFEVQAVLNPATARVGDETVLLIRVAERPRSDIDPPADARTLDLSGLHPKVVPLPPGYRRDEVVPIAVADPDSVELRHIAVYLRRDLEGLDCSDPRGVTFTNPKLDKTVTFLTQVSHLRCARSRDGVHFTVDEQPAIWPTTHLEEYGCEDARATLIDGVWHITYVAVSRVGVTPSLALTRDFKHFEKRGALISPDNKDAVLFPIASADGYTALTRPMPSSFGHVLGIWLQFPDHGLPWGGHQPLVLPREGYWDERQTGAGTVPLRCGAGWLEIYHGVVADHTYALGAVLLKGDDPGMVLARSAEPILRPEASYERAGLLSNVVFTCGHVPLDDQGDRIRVYYGAADSVIAAADFSVAEILDSLGPPDSPAGHQEKFLT